MDLAPIFYLLLTLVFLAAILRCRKIVITNHKNEPRRHRTTYRKAQL